MWILCNLKSISTKSEPICPKFGIVDSTPLKIQFLKCLYSLDIENLILQFKVLRNRCKNMNRGGFRSHPPAMELLGVQFNPFAKAIKWKHCGVEARLRKSVAKFITLKAHVCRGDIPSISLSHLSCSFPGHSETKIDLNHLI